MRIHTDHLSAMEIQEAAEPGVLAIIDPRASRSRRYGYEVFLEWVGPREHGDGRRRATAATKAPSREP